MGKTKRLIATNFVPMLGALTDPALRILVAEEAPTEECRLVILDSVAQLRSESVYANPKVAYDRLTKTIAARPQRTKGPASASATRADEPPTIPDTSPASDP